MSLYTAAYQAYRDPDPARTRVAVELRHNSPLLSCRFDPSGHFVFAGAQDNTIQRWELATQRRTTLTGHRSWVRGLTFHPRDNKLLSGDFTGRVLIWSVDAESPEPERTVQAHRGWARDVCVSPDGRHFATCGNDNLVKLWTFATGELVREFSGHPCHVYTVAFHPAGQFLVSGDLRGNVKQWEIATGRETRALDATVLFRHDNTFRADHGGIRSMAFNVDGSLLACAGITEVTNAFAGVGKPAVVLFNWQTGQRQQVLRAPTAFQGTAWGVGFHPRGYLAAAGGGSGGALWFWRPDNAQPFNTVALPNNARDLHFHSDDRRIAVPFYDSTLRVYTM